MALGDCVGLALGHLCQMTGLVMVNQCETVVLELVASLDCHALLAAG